MHNVTMSKVTGGTAIRTDEVVGNCHELPVVGSSFAMFSEPLTKGMGVRWITTSTIQKVTPLEDCVMIDTLNSTYKLVFE